MITAKSGTPQAATVASVFATNLQALVADSTGHAVPNVTVTFTAPTSGASGTFPGSSLTATATTDNTGTATAPVFTANATTGGPYNVAASVAGVATPANFSLTNAAPTSHPAFFTGEAALTGGVYYLQFPDNNLLGYYNFVAPAILYHYDLGYEAFVPGSGADLYLFDFAASYWLYTSPTLFPYLYDFTLNTWIYYFPDTKNPGHYTTNPRSFSNLTTGKIFTM